MGGNLPFKLEVSYWVSMACRASCLAAWNRCKHHVRQLRLEYQPLGLRWHHGSKTVETMNKCTHMGPKNDVLNPIVRFFPRPQFPRPQNHCHFSRKKMFLQFMFLGLLCECSGVSSWSGSWRLERQLRDCHRLPANILCAPCFATRITQEWNMARIRFPRTRQMLGPDFRHIWEAASEGTCPTAKAACKREGPCFVGAFVLAFAFDVFFRSVSHDILVPWLYLISLVSLLTGKQFWNSSGLILWLTGRRRKWRRACPGSGVVPWIGI